MTLQETLSFIAGINEELEAIVGRFYAALRYAIKKAVKPALADYIAKRQRIDRIIAMTPQYLKVNPMCRDPWHRGRRAAFYNPRMI